MSDSTPSLQLHAPWFVEGVFDVNLYYHGWHDSPDPCTPTVPDTEMASDAYPDDMSVSSVQTVAYHPAAAPLSPPRPRVRWYIGKSDVQLIEPRPSQTAECVARELLSQGAYYEDQLPMLWALLPGDTPRPHQSAAHTAEKAFTFTTGAFQVGGLVGIRSHAYNFPWVTAFLCRLVHSILGNGIDYRFTSITLLVNVSSGLHRDGNNNTAHPHCRSKLIPLSCWTGGELWCQDAAGTLAYPGTDLLGKAYAVAPPFLEFDSGVLHGTLPWQGDRVVLAVYNIKTVESLSDGEMAFLKHVGFAPL